MISSELEEVVEGSDRVVVLKNGSVVGTLSGDDISEENLMETLAEGGSSETGESAGEEGDDRDPVLGHGHHRRLDARQRRVRRFRGAGALQRDPHDQLRHHGYVV